MSWTVTLAVLGLMAALTLDLLVAGTVAPEGEGLPLLELVTARRLSILVRTIGIALLATTVATVFGVALATLVGCSDVPGKSLLSLLCVLSLTIPPYLQGMSWLLLLGDDGLLHTFLPPWFSLYNEVGVGLVLGLSLLPLVFVIVRAGLSLAHSREEEAALLSVTPWKTVWSITLRRARPSIVAASALVFTVALGNYAIPSLYSVDVFVIEIYSQYSAFMDHDTAASLSALLAVAALPALLLVRSSFARLGSAPPPRPRERPVLSLGSARWAAFGILGLVILGLSGVPLLTLTSIGASQPSFLDSAQMAREELTRSFTLALGTGLLAGVLGLMVAYQVTRNRWITRCGLDLLLLVPLAVPSVTLGITLSQVLNRPGVPEWLVSSSAVLLLAHTLRFLPIAFLLGQAYFQRQGNRLEEAAWCNGVPPGKTAWGVVCPGARAALASIVVLVGFFSLAELGTTLIIYPPGKITLPVRLFTIWHYGKEEVVACLGVLASVVAALLTTAYWVWMDRPMDILSHDRN